MVVAHAWRSVWRPINAWWSHTIARLLTFFVLTMILVMHRAPSTALALEIYRGMVNLPRPWYDALGPVGRALGWLGGRFDGPRATRYELELVFGFVVLNAFLW